METDPAHEQLAAWLIENTTAIEALRMATVALFTALCDADRAAATGVARQLRQAAASAMQPANALAIEELARTLEHVLQHPSTPR